MLIGLTGGIAAGKSVVAQELRQLGAAVLDADRISREVMAPGPVVDEIVARFGAEILDRDGRIDRARLGGVVFGDAVAREALEAITHPAIAREAARQIARLQGEGHRQIFYEAALLVEAGRHTELDRLVVVIADEAVRLQRIQARDGLSAEAARARIQAQLPQEAKAALADYLIDNSGALEQTRERVREVWQQIRGEGS